MTRADGGQLGADRPIEIHHASARNGALEGTRDLFFDLRPSGCGDRGEFAMQIIHA
jgi:hypothetical protein